MFTSEYLATCVRITEADARKVQGGGQWQIVDGKVMPFAKEEPDPDPASERQYSFAEFMDLFTRPEQMTLAGAAMTDVTAKLWYDRAMGSRFILLSDPEMSAGLDYMVAAELITPERAAEVLAGTAPIAVDG